VHANHNRKKKPQNTQTNKQNKQTKRERKEATVSNQLARYGVMKNSSKGNNAFSNQKTRLRRVDQSNITFARIC
jgi:hypothetical protein